MIATVWARIFPSGVTMNGNWPSGGRPAETKSNINQRIFNKQVEDILTTSLSWSLIIKVNVIIIIIIIITIIIIIITIIIIIIIITIIIIIIIIILSYFVYHNKTQLKNVNTITTKYFDRTMQPLKLSKTSGGHLDLIHYKDAKIEILSKGCWVCCFYY